MYKKPVLFNKMVIIGIIILFVGMIAISCTARGEYWYTARVKCNLKCIPYDAVQWNAAFPNLLEQKRFVIGLKVFSTKGYGTLQITPLFQPTITYNLPEDFKSFDVWFMRKMPIYGYIRLQPEPLEPTECRFECWAIGFPVFVN